MGWGSAGVLFDEIAEELIEAGVAEPVLERVCLRLARTLMDGDWDRDDESVGRFNGVPAVQHAIFRARAYKSLYDDEGDTAGFLEYDPSDGGSWLLDDNGDTMRAPGTVAGFNELIGVWADRGGRTAEDYLLTRS